MRFSRSLQIFKPRASNTLSLPQEFLRYGNSRKVMTPDWTEVMMSDRDHYSGYGYSAITRRARKVAQVALENIHTDNEDKKFVHPYLEVIINSRSFSNYKFWETISTYLDLEGWFPLMAIRNIAEERIGEVQEFKLLNPYYVRRVLDPNNLNVTGYIEQRGSLYREIPPQMIIDIRELNPFNEFEPFAMTDAAKESQFTLKTAGDYTRHALKNNINAPGILATDIVLEEEQFKNFTKRVKEHNKGEPIFSNGGGSIKFDDMQIALKDAALPDVRETNRDELFSTYGQSKTIMGIEQSGTTRETANVQKDLNMEYQIIPRIQLIIDALNQDYINYDARYLTNKTLLVVDNPSEADFDADLAASEVRQAELDLYQSLINKAVPPDLAAKYVKGEVGVEALTMVEKMELPVVDPNNPDNTDNPKDNKDAADKKKKDVKKKLNSTDGSRGSLQNTVQLIEQKLVAVAIRNVRKHVNDITSESDIIPSIDKTDITGQFKTDLSDFYNVIMQLKGSQVVRDRVGQYNLSAEFVIDKVIEQYIKETAIKVSGSHIDTISHELYQLARESAAAGKSQYQIEDDLRTAYANISRDRAKLVARTETNRIYTRSQFEADRQFIEQNDLQEKAYKVWHTRSGNPCPGCKSLEDEGEVPFNANFRDLGGEVEADGRIYKINFESLEAGNLHPNCSCDYELIVRFD
jgi:hypothetical protein